MTRTEKNIIIVGAGVAGRLLTEDVVARHPSVRIIGLIDDNPSDDSFNILGAIDDFPVIVTKYLIHEIVLAIPSADGKLVRRILKINRDNQIPIKIVPRSQHIIGQNRVRYEEVKDLEPEDILGRPFIKQDVEKLKDFYRHKVVMVTGGAGSIGSEIVRQLIDLEVKRVIVYDNSEYLIFMLEQQLREQGTRDRCELIIGSVTNPVKLNHVMKRHKPDFVFHAAAYKHVHLLQDNIDEAVINNVIGTKWVVDTATINKVKVLTFISTDKVVNPTSVLGATKKMGEYYIAVQPTGPTQFNIVRFGNVINSNGSALPLFERQIKLHKYVTVTHEDMERFFMSIREAAQLVIESTAFGKSDHIHVLNMGELIKIHDVALALIRSQNLRPGRDVEIRVTGLRKGEKMYEELYTADEKRHMRRSKDSRIFQLKAADICPFDINKTIAQFETMTIKRVSQAKLKAELNHLFPSLKLPK